MTVLDVKKKLFTRNTTFYIDTFYAKFTSPVTVKLSETKNEINISFHSIILRLIAIVLNLNQSNQVKSNHFIIMTKNFFEVKDI